MKRFLNALAGGLLVMVIAGALGVAFNGVRSQPIRLIQKAPPVGVAGGAAGDHESGAQAAVPEAPSAAGLDAAGVAALVDAGAVFVIDARSPDAFAEGHIPGAINIPYDRLPEYLTQLQAEVPTDAPVVCYCWSPTCDFSDQLASELGYLGYTDVRVFKGGWEEWTAAEQPAEQGGGE